MMPTGLLDGLEEAEVRDPFLYLRQPAPRDSDIPQRGKYWKKRAQVRPTKSSHQHSGSSW